MHFILTQSFSLAMNQTPLDLHMVMAQVEDWRSAMLGTGEVFAMKK